MKEAADLLARFELHYEKRDVSANRTPDMMAEYGKNARERGSEVSIAGACGAAHQQRMLASYITLPVIGVPIQTSALGEIDSLYSIVQMTNGIPVATVAIGKAANAAFLALRILSITDKKIAEALEGYHANMARESIRKTENLV